MFSFRNQEKVCWHQCLYTHCLKKKEGKKKSSTTYNDHTVPSCPRQTNPGSPFPQNWFLSACSKKMKCIWCSTEKHREFVWGMCIKREAPSLTHFFVSCPLSLSFSHAHTYANLQNSVHVQTQLHLQMCKHTSPHIYTHCNTLRAPSAYYKKNILQRDKKNKKKNNNKNPSAWAVTG